MSARKTLTLRIALDCVLLAICATIFSKNVISLMYHEVVGLVLFLLFAVHIAFNRKWLAALQGAKRRSGRARATVVVNLLLILSWAGVLVTGILVSKKLFPFQISSLNPLHFFFSALALVMTGVHFGLHWNYFWGWMGKRVPLPRVAAVLLCVVIIAFGGYRTITSSFGRWIAAPFTPHEAHEQRGAQEAQAHGEAADPAIVDGNAAEPTPADGDAQPSSGQPASQRGSHGQQPFSLANLLYTIATWFSMLFFFAAITHGTERLAAGKRPA